MPDASRAALDRGRVLSAAVQLADREGLDAVSMRALAAELGVVPMALYKHVADKDDLRSGMIDRVVSGYARIGDGLEWKDAVRGRIRAARAAHLEHPWLRAAIETSTRRTPVVLGHMDAVAGDLIGGGLSVDLTHHAMHALGHRIWGFSPEAFASAGAAPAGPSTGDQEEAMRLMAERFPNVAAIAMDAASRSPSRACDDEFEFEFTLDLLLDAVERLHASGWSSRPLGD